MRKERRSLPVLRASFLPSSSELCKLGMIEFAGSLFLGSQQPEREPPPTLNCQRGGLIRQSKNVLGCGSISLSVGDPANWIPTLSKLSKSSSTPWSWLVSPSLPKRPVCSCPARVKRRY
ncbi:hypothetical protein CIHG_00219 [Coccidioides immitis H538.4]|uniref:Uncharacterized protein n=3 Tax=Coccidioides immitis TaxID=5501 RepID=A0A0J8QIB6_COCIT|nr:hypothetical protein CIRG_07038 [Coccidioides immitis RMSCC 2394]KMU72190.1 hypothetical protein CISG_00499 [Coccidioides immitis RMSCC 3703]KMU82437.1 hypothetical protein CIHG_00219 [Coccidioides immitis H538.4]